jgi:PBP4 family serine-type D-alanyl-D-alanine carboxypeptidase
MMASAFPKLSCLGTIGFLLIASRAPAQSSANLARRIHEITARAEFKSAIFGMEFYTLDTERVLFALNADKLFVPGSTTKLLTEGTALALLGTNYRFHTRLYRTGSISSDGTLDADLVLVAAGDPNLSGRPQPDGSLAFENIDHSYSGQQSGKVVPGNPLLDINELAQQVRRSGVKKISGNILVDVSMFPEGQREAGTGVVISPIALNDNIVDVTIFPGKEGEIASLKASPDTSYVKFVSHVKTGKSDSSRQLVWGSDDASPDGEHTVAIEGMIPEGPPVLIPYPVAKPSLFAEFALAEELRRQGIEVTTQSKDRAVDFKALRGFYKSEYLIAEHISPFLKEDVKVTLKVSQNLHASMVPYIVGAVLAPDQADPQQAGLDAERAFLEKEGLDINSASQADGAGGAGAFFTPDFMVHYLESLKSRTISPRFLTRCRSWDATALYGTLT